jgi:hypothetical protein
MACQAWQVPSDAANPMEPFVSAEIASDSAGSENNALSGNHDHVRDTGAPETGSQAAMEPEDNQFPEAPVDDFDYYDYDG